MPTLFLFVNSLSNKIFKILPLCEEKNAHIADYIDSLCVELLGGSETFSLLKQNESFLSLINILRYLSANEFTHKQCKREVFKMLDIVEKLKSIAGGDKVD